MKVISVSSAVPSLLVCLFIQELQGNSFPFHVIMHRKLMHSKKLESAWLISLRALLGCVLIHLIFRFLV